MKKNRKKIIFIVLIVIMILGIASTSLAYYEEMTTYDYSADTTVISGKDLWDDNGSAVIIPLYAVHVDYRCRARHSNGVTNSAWEAMSSGQKNDLDIWTPGYMHLEFHDVEGYSHIIYLRGSHYGG